MNLTFMTIGKLLLAVIVISGLALCGCESDPILSPQVEETEETGSYGNTNLPASGTQTTENAAKSAQNNLSDSNRAKATNPERF